MEAALRRNAPIYLFHGEEGYLVEDTARGLIRKLLSGEQAEFRREILSGPGVSIDEIGGALTTLPLFGGPRVVWLRGCELFKSAERAKSVLPLLPGSGCGTTVVITETKADKRSALYREIEKSGLACEFPPLSENDDAHLRFIYELASEKLRPDRVSISRTAIFSLVQLAGTDIRNLLTEVEKLALHAGPGGTITQEEIDLLVTPRREVAAYLLADSVASGKAGTALSMLKRILSQGSEPLGILESLTRRFRFLLQAKELMRSGIVRWSPSFPAFKRSLENAPEALRAAFKDASRHKRYSIFGQHPYAAYKICESARGIPLDKLRGKFDLVANADSALKRGRSSKFDAIQDLVISLCG